ncbi:hypothetical protein [Deinococcus sp.]|uniref:hypothetical protein n=1 Tax=Deinococcus sp. TaxID=47478 RepID=UPI00286982E4|nr:hypothetical protein [Deinococcus sp.]
MVAVLLFVVLPVILIVLAWRIKPLVPQDGRPGDAVGGSLVASGMFGSHGLEADPRSVPEDTETVRFDLTDVKARE